MGGIRWPIGASEFIDDMVWVLSSSCCRACCDADVNVWDRPGAGGAPKMSL
jgi:hypothetical protein